MTQAVIQPGGLKNLQHYGDNYEYPTTPKKFTSKFGSKREYQGNDAQLTESIEEYETILKCDIQLDVLTT